MKTLPKPPKEPKSRTVRYTPPDAAILVALGARVRKFRKRTGISQDELGARAGLHRTYIADVERGARNISLLSIHKLAEGLAVPVTQLFADNTSLDGPNPAP